MEKCTRCGKEFETYESLRKHVGRLHKVDSHTFYVEHYLKGEWPTCKCGCSGKVKWDAENKKFRDYVQGHQSRVSNNWGNNPAARKRSLETRRTRFASGEITTWNKGLTKESDERVAANGEGRAASITPEDRKMYSDQMRKTWLSGAISIRYGKDHSQWAGGVSSVKSLAHCSPRLYREWRYPIMIRDGFKCVKCGSTNDLQVHHDKETMAKIVRMFVHPTTPENLPFEEKQKLAERIIDYHVKNLVPGVTLCHDCHAEFHPSLNFR